MTKEEIIQFIAENLRLEVITRSNYTGGDPMYSDCKSIKLTLCDEVISEVDL